MGKTKPGSINVRMAFGFDVPNEAVTASRLASGKWIFISDSGEYVVPKQALRIAERERLKKPENPKILSIMPIDPEDINDNGLTGTLTKYDEIYAIDCNNSTIANDSLHVAAFITASFKKYSHAHVELIPENHVRILEFRNIKEKSENIAWKNLIENLNKEASSHNLKIGIIVDSDLENIGVYNTRQKPIYDEFYLPKNMDLIYATSDSSVEMVNKLIRLADAASSRFIKELRAGIHNGSELEIHVNQPYSHFRFWKFNNAWDVDCNDLLKGLQIPDGTVIQFYGQN